MTNIEEIRNMDSRELAHLICTDKCSCCRFNHQQCGEWGNDCVDGVEEWLNSETKPILNAAQRNVLENLSETYKNEYIKRDEYNGLCLVNKSNEAYDATSNFNMYSALFDFIETGDCYKISELLEKE